MEKKIKNVSPTRSEMINPLQAGRTQHVILSQTEELV